MSWQVIRFPLKNLVVVMSQIFRSVVYNQEIVITSPWLIPQSSPILKRKPVPTVNKKMQLSKAKKRNLGQNHLPDFSLKGFFCNFQPTVATELLNADGKVFLLQDAISLNATTRQWIFCLRVKRKCRLFNLNIELKLLDQ